MRKKTKIIQVIMICLLVFLFVSCTGTSDPVTRQLNKLENVIEKYEKQSAKNKLTEADIEKMQAELLSIGIKAPDNITPVQEQRFSQLGDRMDRLEAAAIQEEK
jgi:PBP1b-binding outer membrane lipoprotein LpoB